MAAHSRGRWAPLSAAVGREGRRLWSRSADPGQVVHQEQLRRMRGAEWRAWDPTRSKLAAAILRTQGDGRRLLPRVGATALYLGAGHGSSLSHLHDHTCGPANEHKGRLIGVDVAPRCVRDLNALARRRPGLVPVLGDARTATTWQALLPRRVEWLFQDVALAGQHEVFIRACRASLAPGGIGLLSLKTRSERRRGEADADIVDLASAACSEAGLEVEEVITLAGWEDGHALIVVRAPADWPLTD